MKYGLSAAHLQQITNCLRQCPEIEKAVLFGSRAMDTYKAASDVDIAIFGENADVFVAAHVKYELEEETYLPYFFDVIAYNDVDNEALKEHIQTFGVVIYSHL